MITTLLTATFILLY